MGAVEQRLSRSAGFHVALLYSFAAHLAFLSLEQPNLAAYGDIGNHSMSWI